jgi:hypothetical protein
VHDLFVEYKGITNINTEYEKVVNIPQRLNQNKEPEPTHYIEDETDDSN